MRKTHESINDQHSSQRACALLRARVRNNYGCGAVKCAFHLRAIAHVFDLPHKRHRTTSQKNDKESHAICGEERKMSLATLMCVCLLFFFACLFIVRLFFRFSLARLFISLFICFFLICYPLCCLFCWLAACLVDLGKTFFFPSENKTRLSHKLSQTHTHTNYIYIHSVIYTQTRAHKETRAQTSS